MLWNHAGEITKIDEGNEWLHGSVDPSEWPLDTPEIYRCATYGDRRQELVFIGVHLNEVDLRKRLEEALVTDVEFDGGLEAWAKWPNPFASNENVAEEGAMVQKETEITARGNQQYTAVLGAPESKKLKKEVTPEVVPAEKKSTSGGYNTLLDSSRVGCTTSPGVALVNRSVLETFRLFCSCTML